MVADVILLQVALMLALMARFYFVVFFEGVGTATTVGDLLSRYQSWYLTTAFPLTSLFCTPEPWKSAVVPR